MLTIPASSRPNVAQRAFSSALESVRKDVECSFGMLQARLAFMKTPVRLWNIDDIKSAVLA
jgi:Plant transposon protein